MTTPETVSLDLLHVSELAYGELAPTRAFLHVLLASDRFFSGRAALAKAEELRRLVGLLVAKGFSEDAVSLEGAALDVSSGLFTKSSSVTYRVRIEVKEIDRVAEALDVVADCKKATLTNMTWDYANAPLGTKLLADCAARAMAKAEVLASALGLVVEGIHAVREGEIEEGGAFPPGAGGGYGALAPMRARGSIATELAGLDLAPKKKVGVRVALECRVRRP